MRQTSRTYSTTLAVVRRLRASPRRRRISAVLSTRLRSVVTGRGCGCQHFDDGGRTRQCVALVLSNFRIPNETSSPDVSVPKARAWKSQDARAERRTAHSSSAMASRAPSELSATFSGGSVRSMSRSRPVLIFRHDDFGRSFAFAVSFHRDRARILPSPLIAISGSESTGSVTVSSALPVATSHTLMSPDGNVAVNTRPPSLTSMLDPS